MSGTGVIETVTAREACVQLRRAGISMTESTLYQALAEKVFPFGFCLKRSDGSTTKCVIYKNELLQWIKEKSSS